MRKTFFDFGSYKRSSVNDRFISLVKERYGLTVMEIEVGGGRLSLWMDLSRKSDPRARWLYDAVRINGRGVSLDSDMFPPDIQAFAYELIDCYAACGPLEADIEGACYLYLYDFVDRKKEYAYGHAIARIKQRLDERYGVFTTVCYEPIITILCRDEERVARVERDKKQIAAFCYKELKRHDTHNLLTEEDVCIQVFLESELDPKKRIAYRMSM